MAACLAILFWFQGVYPSSVHLQWICTVPSPLAIPSRGLAGALALSLLLMCQSGGQVFLLDLELSSRQAEGLRLCYTQWGSSAPFGPGTVSYNCLIYSPTSTIIRNVRWVHIAFLELFNVAEALRCQLNTLFSKYISTESKIRVC